LRRAPRSLRRNNTQRQYSTGARTFPKRQMTKLREPQIRDPHTFIIVELMRDEVGGLSQILREFEKADVNITHLESKLMSHAHQGPHFHIDFQGSTDDPKVEGLIAQLNKLGQVHEEDCREVPWFPATISDLDFTQETIDGGDGLINEDHPGFTDETYKKRRRELSAVTEDYRHGQEIPYIDYNDDERATWKAVFEKLSSLSKQYACEEYHSALARMELYCGYSADDIPQLNDISGFLQQETGFSLRPVQGLLSARDFLNALAFRVFFSTQYIRHHGNPFYTPEPDICHELMGHAPMFADRNFADFSQQIGLASLAASDEDIDKLASCYWFTVEFGLVEQQGKRKAIGAGLLSSFGEMEWACSDTPSPEVRDMGGMTANHPSLTSPSVRPFKPEEAAVMPFPITTYQPVYFMAGSTENMKTLMSQYADLKISQPFYPQYDALTKRIRVTKAVTRGPRTSTLELQAQKQKEYFENLKPGLSVDGACEPVSTKKVEQMGM